MHLRSLELFCAVAELRSFSKAAAVHDLTQSAVSQAIQQLEESLGAKLIDRSTRPLVLTNAGSTYLRGVRSMLRTYHRLEQEIRSTSERLSGQLRIGTIYSVGLSYMPEATEAFHRMHPEVEIQTEFGANEKIFEMTADGDVDFGLVSFPKTTKQLQYVMWQQEPMRLVCSPDHSFANRTDITLHDLQGTKMVGFARELTLRKEIDHGLLKAGVSVDIQMEFDNADSMIRAIQANRGIGIVPEAAVRRETATGSLRVVACQELRMTRPLGIIFRRSGRLSKAASEFGSLLLGRPLETEKRSRSGSTKHAAGTTNSDAKSGKSVVA
ncbi:MAG: LysR family transcriptional regulator [Pirellulaceae bacterium]|nr:LysR family transcriptional regulator [Pirellulaceae bacterium]